MITGSKVSKPMTALMALLVWASAMMLLPSQGKADDFAAIKAAAAKEGTLVFWASTPAQQTTDALVALFNKRFGMNIKVERVAVSAKDVAARLLTEKRAGTSTVDVSIVSDETMPILIKGDVLEKVDWVNVFGDKIDKAQLQSSANNLMPDFVGYGLEFRHLVYGIAYNTKAVAKQDVPTKWEDLADPKWKRKLTIDAGLDPLKRLAPVIGKDAVLALAKRIVDNDPVYANGTRNALQKIVAGEAPIGALAVNTVLEEQKKGAPVDFVIPEPQSVISQQLVFVVKNAPHPNLAKLWTAWFGSEGMVSKPMIDEGSLRARAGAPGVFGDYFTKHHLTTRVAQSVAELDAASQIGKELAAVVRARRH